MKRASYMELNLLSPNVELHNVILGPDGLETRGGLYAKLNIEDVGVFTPRTASGTQTSFVFGFSAESANTGDVFHYIFSIDSSNNLYQSIYDEQFECRAYSVVGVVNSD